MAVTDLTGTIWLINETPTKYPFTGINPSVSVTFVSNNASYSGMMLSLRGSTLNTISYVSNSTVNAYSGTSGWLNEAYRTVEITGGVAVTESNTITWFENNAVQQILIDDVVISYNGSDIASMTESGTKTLLTADSYCENNIVVTYTKPAAPAPNLQAKTNIAPTTSSQTITADSGYDGLSSVQINAISPVRTSSDLTASGATVSVPAGYYASAASKAVTSGSATTPSNLSIYANPSYYIDEWGSLYIYSNGRQFITPTVSAGYVSSGTGAIVRTYANDSFDLASDGYAFDGTVDDYDEEEEGGGA